MSILKMKTITLSNAQIEGLFQEIQKNIIETVDQSLPIKVSFCIQKNIKTLSDMVELIDSMRRKIIEKYGKVGADGSYSIPEEVADAANEEYAQLMMLGQEFSIATISLADFGDINFTLEQMNSIMFMIEESD